MSFRYDLTQLKTKDQLTNFLGLDERIFDDVLAFDPSSQNSFLLFYRHKIPKKDARRGYRTVWEPTVLKNNYKALARRLENFFKFKLNGFPHARTFGYVGGRNIRENARDHCGHKHLISIDLKNFFPSIKTGRVEALLRSMEMTPAVAALLSRFVTIEGSLPLGLPTSPTIANAICLPMDLELGELAAKCGATFSRYADDISLSSHHMIPSQDDMESCIQRHGFEIAKSKTRRSKLGQAHYVTGLSVSDSAQPHVPRERKRALRQHLYYAGKYGLGSHLRYFGLNDPNVIQREVNRLDGLVKFTAYHEPRHSTQLKTAWAKILQASGYRPSFRPKNQDREPFYLYVDEAEYVRPDGNRVLALAIAATQHQDRINSVTQEVLDATLSDMWAAGNKDAVARKGVHFSDAAEDLKLVYVERMRFLPFEGYVAMAQLPSTAEYEATYLRLLGAMVKRRLMAAESQLAYWVFEQNNKVSQEAVRKVVMDAYISLKRSNNRHPQLFYVEFAGKPNLGLSVPDFLLGVLGRYRTAKPDQEGKPIGRDKLLFERIRDKYRLILDVDSWTEFTRRRPIEPW